MKNIADLWNSALASIEKKISKPSFETWLKSTSAHSLDGNTLIIIAPNEFARDWLEERYSGLISGILYEITGEELGVKFIIPQSQTDLEEDEPPQNNKNDKKIYSRSRTQIQTKIRIHTLNMIKKSIKDLGQKFCVCS